MLSDEPGAIDRAFAGMGGKGEPATVRFGPRDDALRVPAPVEVRLHAVRTNPFLGLLGTSVMAMFSRQYLHLQLVHCAKADCRPCSLLSRNLAPRLAPLRVLLRSTPMPEMCEGIVLPVRQSYS
jgi:hypothetical protein